MSRALRGTRGPAGPCAPALALLALALLPAAAPAQTPLPVVPKSQRSQISAERSGTHDAANIRTLFHNFGMVGDYPLDPQNADLSIFHSVEVPKGTGMNYSDGITPFVLAKIRLSNGEDRYIMETGFRERQAESPYTERIMRFEPRPGYFEPDPAKNVGRSIAISSDPRTWPGSWPDKVNDPDDPGWGGSWDGYFGKSPAADQESYSVMDDDFYDAWKPYWYPDSRDPTRAGLGLKVGVRGFQWANPQADNVIFWHYDVTNEGTTLYDNDVVFGLYMDSGVGGSLLSCDGIYESDDDNAFFDKSSGLNLVYTWDLKGHGRDLRGNCSPTGYLGYAYLETPGNRFDGVDDDDDGITDERRDGGPGELIVSQDAILAYVAAHYDTSKVVAHFGPIADRPAYRVGRWWTGDEDMDWVAEFNDVGADGAAETHDTGEGDGVPTEGEPNFDRTDIEESDQIGLTGFKLNRIKIGEDNHDPNAATDGILFYTETQNWPERLYRKFTDPDSAVRYDPALASNYNIGFLFASGPFRLQPGQTERFSLALAYGADLDGLRRTVKVVQRIYNGNYRFAVAPTRPVVTAEAGDHKVRLSWDDAAERSVDPVSNEFDFEGYRIYRSTDPDFLDARIVTTGGGAQSGNGRPVAQFDLANGISGFSPIVVEDLPVYFLGNDSGILHTWEDDDVTNGQDYYYAVCAYDRGSQPLEFYPSENSYSISRTLRGGTLYPTNVVHVRPNPRVTGFERASVGAVQRVHGRGTGTVRAEVADSPQVPEGHRFRVRFFSDSPDTARANRYALEDSTADTTLFATGSDFSGAGRGPVGAGVLPIVESVLQIKVDDTASGFQQGSPTNARFTTFGVAANGLAPSTELKRPGYPDNIVVRFASSFVDTGSLGDAFHPAKPAKFRVYADTDSGETPLRFVFQDDDNDGTLSKTSEKIDVLTTRSGATPTRDDITWRIQLDPSGPAPGAGLVPPSAGDVYRLIIRVPFLPGETFAFTSHADHAPAAGRAAGSQPYVVPNPYLGAASFEPAPFNIKGRGERRIEFRGVAQGAVVRIYSVHGDLVQTLRQDGSFDGFVPWNLRSKDNLDVAPGLYVFHVEAPGEPGFTGKFAVVK